MYYSIGGTLPKREGDQKFSTFLALEEGERRMYFKWLGDRALTRDLKLRQQREPDFLQFCQTSNEISLVQYFLEICQNDTKPLNDKNSARKSIFAYLETPRYKAALDRFKKYKDFKNPQETWEEYLYIAGKLASDLEKISQIFQRLTPNQPNLEEHFRLELASAIRDIFYTQTGQGKYSPWCALSKASDRKLKEGLQYLGVEETDISSYILARDSLFKVYSRSGTRWLEPKAAQYQAATEYRNRHYGQAEMLVSVEKFKGQIKVCLKALQASPSLCHLDYYDDTKLIEKSKMPEQLLENNPLTAIENQEYAEQLQKHAETMKTIFLKQLESFEEREKKMLFLRYGKGMSGAKVGAEIGTNQSTVSRGCQRCVRQLLKTLTEWGKNDS